jgi:SAM-dependent methyltransferase
MNEVIGAHHEFHDAEFVAGWADRFVPTPERLRLFDVILSELKLRIPPNGCVVELGIGPGYLANHLLRAMPEIQYFGVDFSSPMLDIARQRLSPHSARVACIQADLVTDNWWTDIPTPVSAFVSTWALHDLGSQENVEVVYKSCANILQDGGILINGDFIKPEKAIHEYEPGRFEIAKHIAMLRRVGFKSAECLVVLEEEIESPTAAQNYACIKGVA